MLAVLSLSFLVAGASARCVLGPEYWTTVHDGKLGPEVTCETDLMLLPDTIGWMAFWNETSIFGHAYKDEVEEGKYCAVFAAEDDTPTKKCDGFQILTKNQNDKEDPSINTFGWFIPTQAHGYSVVGYNDHIAARKENEVTMQNFYGDVQWKNYPEYFHGVDPSETPLVVRKYEDYIVYLLHGPSNCVVYD